MVLERGILVGLKRGCTQVGRGDKHPYAWFSRIQGRGGCIREVVRSPSRTRARNVKQKSNRGVEKKGVKVKAVMYSGEFTGKQCSTSSTKKSGERSQWQRSAFSHLEMPPHRSSKNKRRKAAPLCFYAKPWKSAKIFLCVCFLVWFFDLLGF